MNILAIDSSKMSAQIALKKDKETFVYFMDETKSHSEFLLKEIAQFLKNHEIKIQDVDCIAINVGPGSFTGIRIGISFVKAFMFVLKQKCVIVDNFELISFNIKQKPSSYYVVLNSNNEDFYCAKYENENVSYLSLNSKKLNEIVSKTGELVFCDKKQEEYFKDVINLQKIEVDTNTFINIAVKKVENKDFKNINEICPLYLKKSQAEIGLMQKINQNLVIKTECGVAQIFVLEHKCFDDAYPAYLIEQDVANENRHQFFAFYENELVGYINFEQTLDELSVFRICVLSEFREYGIGTKLMQKMIDYFNSNKQLKSIFLEVDDKNIKAQKLYEKFGFKKISVRKNYYQNHHDAFVYQLKK